MKDTRVSLDVSMWQRQPGAGMNMERAFMCGHKSGTTGAKFRPVAGRQPIAWRCAACNSQKEKT